MSRRPKSRGPRDTWTAAEFTGMLKTLRKPGHDRPLDADRRFTYEE